MTVRASFCWALVRKRAIYRHRGPWDRDRSTAGPWLAAGESARYYVVAGTCESYRARGRTRIARS